MPLDVTPEAAEQVMSTLDTLFKLQTKNRVCGENPIGTQSDVSRIDVVVTN